MPRYRATIRFDLDAPSEDDLREALREEMQPRPEDNFLITSVVELSTEDSEA